MILADDEAASWSAQPVSALLQARGIRLRAVCETPRPAMASAPPCAV